jgi:hypothetical protein
MDRKNRVSLLDSILTACLPCKKDTFPEYHPPRIIEKYEISFEIISKGIEAVIECLPEHFFGEIKCERLRRTETGVRFILSFSPRTYPIPLGRDWYANAIVRIVGEDNMKTKPGDFYN